MHEMLPIYLKIVYDFCKYKNTYLYNYLVKRNEMESKLSMHDCCKYLAVLIGFKVSINFSNKYYERLFDKKICQSRTIPPFVKCLPQNRIFRSFWYFVLNLKESSQYVPVKKDYLIWAPKTLKKLLSWNWPLVIIIFVCISMNVLNKKLNCNKIDLNVCGLSSNAIFSKSFYV